MWTWEYELGKEEVFSFKVVRAKDKAECMHIRTKNVFYEDALNCGTSESYYWQVIVVSPILNEDGNPVLDEDGNQVWNEVSEASEPQYFDYKIGGNGICSRC